MTGHGPLTDAEVLQLEAELYDDSSLYIVAYAYAVGSGFVMGLAVMWAAVKAGWIA